MPTKKKLSLFLLVALIVSAIDSIRNLPATALFGSSLLFFFLFSAIFFLIPVAAIAAELSSSMPEKGGVYHWMTKAFGEKIGMLAIWLQWINTMVWYPTMLSFIVGTFSYFIDPSLAANKIYLMISIMLLFWSLTLLNLFGVHFSALFNSLCGIVGTILPLTLMITFGLYWIISAEVSQIDFSFSSLIPSLTKENSWVSLTAIIASFLGIELAGVHVNDVKNPQKNFPKALGLSVFLLLFTMLFGALSIAVVLPKKSINLIAGVMQVFTDFFTLLGIEWAIPIITALITFGSIGGIINWLISPAKGLLHAAEFGFLPPLFTKKNRYGVAANILIAQAILVTVFTFFFLLVPSVNAFYWFLTALSTDLYILLYILLFVSALKLRKGKKPTPNSFSIPGKKIGIWIVSFFGLIGSLITFIVSFIPPDTLQIGKMRYGLYMATGNLVLLFPVFLFYFYKKRQWKKQIPKKEDSTGRPLGV